MPDTIEKIIGEFGVYQLIIFIFVSSSRVFAAYHVLIIIFLAPRISYVCNGDITKANTCPCSKPVYNRSIFQNTITMEWNLICSKRVFDELTQALFHLGSLFGSLVFGSLSDSFGRKYTLFGSVLLQTLSSLASAAVGNFYLFSSLRFFLGFAVGGTLIISYVYVMEIMGSKYREILSALHQAPFGIGHMLLPVFAYFIRDFRRLIFWTSIGQLFMMTFIFLPESPRWLIAVNQQDRAIHLLTNIARINRRPTENLKSSVIEYQSALELFEELKRKHAHDLVSTKHLRRNTLIMSYLWFSCSFCFYGVSQYIGYLAGNIFLNIGTCGVSAFVSILSSIYILHHFGRRSLMIALNFFSFCCFVMLTFMQNVGEIFFATLGFCAITVLFIMLYIYTLELFPTVVRNAALGISSMVARVGAILASFVVTSNDVQEWLSPVFFCIPPLIAGFVSLLLPETKGVVLTTTIKESEKLAAEKQSDKYEIEDQSDYDTLF